MKLKIGFLCEVRYFCHRKLVETNNRIKKNKHRHTHTYNDFMNLKTKSKENLSKKKPCEN